MDCPYLTVSNFMEKSIGIQRLKQSLGTDIVNRFQKAACNPSISMNNRITPKGQNNLLVKKGLGKQFYKEKTILSTLNQ